MACIQSINYVTLLSCVIGLGLAYYAYFVETNNELDENYVAMCDISEHISCSKVFMSEYGKGFGIVGRLLGDDSILNQPNGIGGMAFYTIVALLTCVNSLPAVKVQLVLGTIANIASVYLAYILFFILYDFCLVCVSTYVLNFAILTLVVAKYRHLTATKTTTKKKMN